MSGVIACDVSRYQVPVNNSYTRHWLIFRAADGALLDSNFGPNLAWCKQACATGRLAGYTAYIVFEPGVDLLAVLQQQIGAPDKHVTVMIDVERWGGKITGDHSAGINHQAERIAHWLGSQKRVLIYANQGDFAALFPNRDTWLRLVVAGYSSTDPKYGNEIGWQYTDGSNQWPHPSGLPVSSAPFGRCDHNIFPGLTPGQLADALGVGEPKEDELSQQDVDAINAHTDAAIAGLKVEVDRVLNEFRTDDNRLFRVPTFLKRIKNGTFIPFAKKKARSK